MSADKKKTLTGGKCPICGARRHADYRPFCSKRCADVDLSRWLKGSYAVPAEEPPDEWDLERALDEAASMTGNDSGSQSRH